MLDDAKTGLKDLIRKVSLFGLAFGTGLYWVVQGLAALDFTTRDYNATTPTYLSDIVLSITGFQVISVLLLAAVALLVIIITNIRQKQATLITSLVFIGFCAGSALAAEHLIDLYVSAI